MLGMDSWDLALLVVAAYVAVVSLVRLMQARRNELLSHLREQLRQQQVSQHYQQMAADRRAEIKAEERSQRAASR